MIEREQKAAAKAASEVNLKTEGVAYNIFEAEFIEEGAVLQMNKAVRLPVSVSGALML